MCDCGCFFTQPWWRPCSVACTVTSHGQPKRRASLRAAPATSQSWEWTRSNDERVAERGAGRAHVVVHGVDPGARRRRGRPSGTPARARGGRSRRGGPRPAASRPPPRASTCTSTPSAHQPLGELANMAGQPALDDRRVLPGQDENAHRHAGRGRYRAEACLPPPPRPPYPGRRDGGAARPRGWSMSRPPRRRPAARPRTRSTGSSRSAAPQSVTEIDRYPCLLDGGRAAARGGRARTLPVLGVCLGAQLLAHALGGSVRRLPRRAVTVASSWRASPTTSCSPDPVWALHWNEDAHRAAARGGRAARRAAASAAPRSGSAARGACSSTPTSTPPRSTAGTRATATGWRAGGRRPRRPPAPRTPSTSPARPATAEAIFGGFVRRARAARSRAPR